MYRLEFWYQDLISSIFMRQFDGEISVAWPFNEFLSVVMGFKKFEGLEIGQDASVCVELN